MIFNTRSLWPVIFPPIQEFPMKHFFPLFSVFLVLGPLLFLSACQSVSSAGKDPSSSPSVPRATVQDVLKLDRVNREVGYQIVGGGEEVVFIFDPKLYGMSGVSRVYLEGSFNGWLKGTDESWLLGPSSGSVWTITKKAREVRIPGNSGHPEFKFYVIKENPKFPSEPNAVSTLSGYQMATNNLVLFPEDDPAEIAENIVTSNTVKALADFDLSSSEQAAILSNVRLVPGTTALYRGYHPFKKSRSQYNTEDTRIGLVKAALEKNGVKSVITLSGEEKVSAAAGESLSPYYQSILDAGHQLTVNTSYNTVYYHSAEADFGNLVQQIVRFINANPGPYYVHCRLGTDRTGTISAVLAGLCGASWPAIAADYQQSNRMGIKEFRDYHLLQYSFEKLLGAPVTADTDLGNGLASCFIRNGYLTQADISTLRERLSGDR
jgi:Protein tyrosine/serine phosphatase